MTRQQSRTETVLSFKISKEIWRLFLSFFLYTFFLNDVVELRVVLSEVIAMVTQEATAEIYWRFFDASSLHPKGERGYPWPLAACSCTSIALSFREALRSNKVGQKGHCSILATPILIWEVKTSAMSVNLTARLLLLVEPQNDPRRNFQRLSCSTDTHSQILTNLLIGHYELFK